jgi:hypothetical protein
MEEEERRREGETTNIKTLLLYTSVIIIIIIIIMIDRSIDTDLTITFNYLAMSRRRHSQCRSRNRKPGKDLGRTALCE